MRGHRVTIIYEHPIACVAAVYITILGIKYYRETTRV